jgi:type IV secretion system protein VirB8
MRACERPFAGSHTFSASWRYTISRPSQVRFTKFARPGGTGDDQATHWVSTIDFAYSKPSSDEKLRSLNPLGFKVVEYQREPEVATQTAPKGAQ